MDALDRLMTPAAELLARVDGALARSGAPDAPRIWPLLRRVGALPGAAVGAISALRPAPLAAAAPSLRTLAQGYADASAAADAVRVDQAHGAGSAVIRVGAAPAGWETAASEGGGWEGRAGWEGAAAGAFAGQWAALRGHLAGGEDSLADRLEATAAYADSVTDWMVRTRDVVAAELARVLVSAEAVVVMTGPATGGWVSPESPAPPATVLACADIGAAVLAPVAGAYEQASELVDDWAPRLAELAYRSRLP